jgi:hypothetical protein
MPVTLPESALLPTAVLLPPVVLEVSALRPTAVLPEPVRVETSAPVPLPVFPLTSLVSLVGGSYPQLTAPPSMQTTLAIIATLPMTRFIHSSLYGERLLARECG